VPNHHNVEWANLPEVDWTNLPEGVQEHSLWECLHDGELFSIRSDLLQRNVVLRFDVSYIRKFHALPLDMRFIFQLDGVQGVRVVRFVKWPGNFSVPNGVTREEESRLIAEYQAKWREESGSWSSVESSITADAPLDISDASLVTGQEEQVALKLTGHDANDEYLEIFLRAERLDVLSSDNRRLGLEQFEKLGKAYWEKFVEKRRNRQTEGE
jgi:hypothetical protein